MDKKTGETGVSVIIPFYSNAEWLCEAVESVFAQEYNNYEVIVVNDGSKEDVSAFLEKYGGRIKYYEKENGGAADARNMGIRNAEGEYIAFLDSDDLWLPEKLSKQLKKMAEYNAQWSYTDFELFGENIEPSVKRMYPDDAEGIRDKLSPYIGTPAVIIKSSLLRDNDLSFCKELRYGQDVCLWEQIYSAAHPLYISEVLCKVRIRGKNAGRRAAVQIRARVDIYDQCVKTIPNFKRRKSALFRLAIALCRFGRLFVPKKRMNSKSSEFIARIMFVMPYLLFKLDRL